jgi:hypothetical protein
MTGRPSRGAPGLLLSCHRVLQGCEKADTPVRIQRIVFAPEHCPNVGRMLSGTVKVCVVSDAKGKHQRHLILHLAQSFRCLHRDCWLVISCSISNQAASSAMHTNIAPKKHTVRISRTAAFVLFALEGLWARSTDLMAFLTDTQCCFPSSRNLFNVLCTERKWNPLWARNTSPHADQGCTDQVTRHMHSSQA